MKIITLFLILAVSISVYAKTEAGLFVTGINIKKSKSNRAVANMQQNDIDAFSQLSSLNKKSTSYQHRTGAGVIGFGSSDGALVAPSKKKRKPKVSLQIIK